MDRIKDGDAPAGAVATGAAEWLVDHVEGLAPPIRFELIAGGNSNLTYSVTDAGGRRMVLRRPPLHGVLATAHDMRREWRAISALGDTDVPVPAAVAFCDDLSVVGAEFYVTEFVAGHVLHDIDATLADSTPRSRATASTSMIEALCALHALEPDSIGLGEHGRRDGNYLERQLHRWRSQFEQTKTEALPDIEHAYDLLVARRPPSTETRVVHGDFRLGNCILARDGTVAAVVDWEISTLGDPLADIAYLLTTWVRPGGPLAGLTGSHRAPSSADGFADADTMLEHYAQRSGRDVSGLAFHLAFNHWRYACIADGVRARHKAGAMGDAPTADLDTMAIEIRERAALAIATLHEHRGA